MPLRETDFFKIVNKPLPIDYDTIIGYQPPKSQPYNSCKYSAEEAFEILFMGEAVYDTLHNIKAMITWIRWKIADKDSSPEEANKLFVWRQDPKKPTMAHLWRIR